MKKITNFLIATLSFMVLFSCIPNKQEAEEIAELTELELTSQEKIQLLTGFQWLVTKPVAAAANNLSSNMVAMPLLANGCTIKNYISFYLNEVKKDGSPCYGGEILYHNFYTGEGSRCYEYPTSLQSICYNPELNTLEFSSYNKEKYAPELGTNQVDPISAPQPLTIDSENNTITLNGITYYKGEAIENRVELIEVK